MKDSGDVSLMELEMRNVRDEFADQRKRSDAVNENIGELNERVGRLEKDVEYIREKIDDQNAYLKSAFGRVQGQVDQVVSNGVGDRRVRLQVLATVVASFIASVTAVIIAVVKG